MRSPDSSHGGPVESLPPILPIDFGPAEAAGMNRSEERPRILIVRLSAIGDTALTMPLLFALRERLPRAHIGWVVGEAAAPLLRGTKQLDRLHVWSDHTAGGLWRLVRELRAGRYGVSIDPQGLSKSALLPYLAGIPRRVGFAPAPLETRELAPLLINEKSSPPAGVTHLSARTLWLGRALGAGLPVNPEVQLPSEERARQRMADWWRSQGLDSRAIVFGIGTSWRNKIWPVTEMALLMGEVRRMDYRPVVLWGPAEEPWLDRWKAILGPEVLWAPRTTIADMIALLNLGDRYAGPDSAALHLAWLLGKPTFSWFGPSDPRRCAPPGPGHAYVAKGPHNFRRSSVRGRGLQALKATEVIPAFRSWLGES